MKKFGIIVAVITALVAMLYFASPYGKDLSQAFYALTDAGNRQNLTITSPSQETTPASGTISTSNEITYATIS